MPKKGTTNNPKGRPKGTPNKITIEMREWIKELINNQRPQLEKDLKSLEPAERWRIIEKLMSYVMPRMQAIDTRIDLNTLTDDTINGLIQEITKDIEQ